MGREGHSSLGWATQKQEGDIWEAQRFCWEGIFSVGTKRLCTVSEREHAKTQKPRLAREDDDS